MSSSPSSPSSVPEPDSARGKRAAAEAAVEYVESGALLGIGTGSTVNLFIDALAASSKEIKGAVPSSLASRELLERKGIPIVAPETVSELPLYIDGADQINRELEMIKGGGAALTGEKIIARMSERMVCIADESKFVSEFTFPLPLEVIPIAERLVREQIIKLGGKPVVREDCRTDYGNIIVDVHDMSILRPARLEDVLNEIPGIVCNGIFAIRPADVLLLGLADGDFTRMTAG